MEKIRNSQLYIVLSAAILCVIIAFAIRYFFGKKEVRAFISSSEIYQGESLSYVDSTYNAKDWLWEFGNGDVSNGKKGEYRYPASGMYQIRLTVNNSFQKEFMVNVRPPVRLDGDSLIKIDAPSKAIQNEYVTFKGVGISKQWRWSFGETGIIDSRDQTAIYAYSLPGIYEVDLTTEDTKYPIKHTIEIYPEYMEVDSLDVLTLVGNDIREKLQAIVDGKPFNPNYNYVMTKYLCNNPDVLVFINNDKRNDFYSYCQGLKILGRKITTIVEVIVVSDEVKPQCVQKLHVTQITHEGR
ncbi:PKD domain-containing protein [Bacteroidia bacterium]|nr:PKD domain-containing protein [Bacteroidia bacterium]GHV29687.1 PKD domain-containing protein [Bacteroidia bacterium]